MTSKLTISKLLNDSVLEFNAFITPLNEFDFEKNPNNKWSAGQDLVHLIKVLKIVNLAFSLPKISLQIMYGINKKEQRSVEALQTLYKNALKGGAQAPSIYIPKPVMFNDKNALIKKHILLNDAFVEKLNKQSDLELDKYKLPHPILGKVTLRELAIFTSFHTVHHFELLKSKIDS